MWESISSDKSQATGQEEITSGCARGGSDSIFENHFSLKERLGIGINWPGRWYSHCLRVFKRDVDIALGDVV